MPTVRSPRVSARAGGASDLSARGRIVAAAIACIERIGVDAASVREIAREAKVNVAAINYYFQSKENLVAIALEQSLDQAFRQTLVDFDRMIAEGSGVAAALEQVLEELIVGAISYPRIAYAHLRTSIVEQRYDTPVIERLRKFVEDLTERLDQAGGARRNARAAASAEKSSHRMAIAEMWCVVLAVGLLPQFFAKIAEVDIRRDEQRRDLVAHLVKSMLSVGSPPKTSAVKQSRSRARRGGSR